MTRALAAWAAATVLTGCVSAQDWPIYVPPNVQAGKLIRHVDPEYPPLGKRMRISGAVELAVWIADAGDVNEIRLIRGHPLLVAAAIDAVKQWRYRPTLWNGRPHDVWTIVTLNFTMRSDGAPDQPGGEQTIVHVSQRHRLAQ